MAQFKVIPPETGTDNVSLWCWSTARGLRIPVKAPWRLRPARSLHSLSECSQCRTRDELLLRSVREVPHSFAFSLPKQSLRSPSMICKPGCKSSACISFPFFFLKEEKSGRVPHIKELCYSTNELPLLSPLSPHLQNSVEHYWSGVLVCRLGHMTEDIFFCYNAKEAPEKDKQKRSIKLKGERKQELNL